MKIIVLHGDDNLESYKRLQTFIDVAQSRNWTIQRISDNSVNIAETLTTDSLFAEKRLIVIEDHRLLDKKTLLWIKKKKDVLDTTLIIYSHGNITKTFLKSLPRVDKVEEFKLPKLIWSYLESFYPENGKNSLLLLHEIIKTEPIEFVFSLLAKKVKDLYWVKVDAQSLLYPAWRIGKLQRQATKWQKEILEDLIFEFSEADIKSKTSQADLSNLLDFIVLEKLV